MMPLTLSNRFRLNAVISLGLLAIILGGATIAGLGYTVVMVNQVTQRITLSDAYTQAKEAVQAEESLERKYRIEPGSAVRVNFDAASSQLLASLNEAARLGGPDDKSLRDQVLRDHTNYLQAITKMFAAVDAADLPLVLEIDAQEDPTYDSIETRIKQAAEEHHRLALANIAKFHWTESLLFNVMLCGLGIILILLLIFGWMFIHERRITLISAENERRALHDELTGLPNRVLFTRHAEEALVRCAKGQQVALMLLDLDRFKEVNDTFGHHVGDELLQQVAMRLSSVIGSTQKLARLSGDEFAAVLPNIADRAEATQVGANMVAAFNDSFKLSGATVSIGISIGISFAPEHGTTVSELLRAADAAMYTAKRKQIGYEVYTGTAI